MLSHQFLLILFLLSCIHQPALPQEKPSSLAGKVICVDAGHGGTQETDSYRVGPSGEREEWVNLRVALELQKMLEEKGAKVLMTRNADDDIPFEERIQLATDHKADVFVSIHHNATADSAVNFPIIYYHGNASENIGSVELGKHLAREIAGHLYQAETPASLASDLTIFPTAGTKLLRGTYGIPGVIAEASFFTNPAEEERLRQAGHNRQEALAYVAALEAFLDELPQSIVAKNTQVNNIPPFKAFQEAERMSAIARNWHQDFLQGKALMQKKDTTSLQEAYRLFTRSARSFPDSYVASECHRNRALLLEKLGQPQEAQAEYKRAKEHYVPLSQ